MTNRSWKVLLWKCSGVSDVKHKTRWKEIFWHFTSIIPLLLFSFQTISCTQPIFSNSPQPPSPLVTEFAPGEKWFAGLYNNIWARNTFNFCFLPLDLLDTSKGKHSHNLGTTAQNEREKALAIIKGSPRDCLVTLGACTWAWGHSRAVRLNSPAVRIVQQQSTAIPQGTCKACPC